MMTVAEGWANAFRGKLAANPALHAARGSYGISIGGVSVTMTFVIMNSKFVRSAEIGMSATLMLYGSMILLMAELEVGVWFAELEVGGFVFSQDVTRRINFIH